MKVFIAFAICIVAVFGDESKWGKKFDEDVLRYRKECITELNLDPRLIDHEIYDTRITPQEATCYQACLDKKIGLMNEDASYNLERLLSFALTPENREEVVKVYNERIKKCHLTIGNDTCKMAACSHNMPPYLWEKEE